MILPLITPINVTILITVKLDPYKVPIGFSAFIQIIIVPSEAIYHFSFIFVGHITQAYTFYHIVNIDLRE